MERIATDRTGWLELVKGLLGGGGGWVVEFQNAKERIKEFM